MDTFKRYLLGKYNQNNKDFKFNTFGIGYKESTMFYLSSKGIGSFVTYKLVPKKDQTKIIKFISNHQTILDHNKYIHLERIKPGIIRVNHLFIRGTCFNRCYERYLELSGDKPI